MTSNKTINDEIESLLIETQKEIDSNGPSPLIAALAERSDEMHSELLSEDHTLNGFQDYYLAAAAFEAGRIEGLRLLEGRGASWLRTDGRWSVSGFEGTGEKGLIEYLEILKKNSEPT